MRKKSNYRRKSPKKKAKHSSPKKSKRKSPNKKSKRKSPNKKLQRKTAASHPSETINIINSIEQDGMIITQYEIMTPSGSYQFFSFNSPQQKVDGAGRPYIIAVDGNVIPIGSKNIVYAGENADFARIHQMVLQHYQHVAMRMAGQRLPNPGGAPLARVNALSLNESKAEDLVARAQRHEKGYYYQP